MAQTDRDYWYEPKIFRKSTQALMEQTEIKKRLCIRSFFVGCFVTCCGWLLIPKVAPFFIELAATGYFLILELTK